EIRPRASLSQAIWWGVAPGVASQISGGAGATPGHHVDTPLLPQKYNALCSLSMMCLLVCCDVVMNLSASQRCEFVKNTPDCASDEGFIKYPVVTFCLFPPNLLPLAITLYVLWLFVLFLVLGLIGVTFLALGNGAPDVFSAMAAFSHPQTAGLAIGALFGAGIFVTTVVAGSIALVKPFTVASRPFLRDVIFYMAAVFWTFIILYKGHISMGEAVGYLGLYIAYVLTVIVSAYIYNRQKHQLNGSAQTSVLVCVYMCVSDDREYEPLLPYTQSTAQIFLNAINPVDSRTWRRQHWSAKVLKVIKVPVEVLLLLTVPVVDANKDDHNWKRPLNCLHIITGPLVCVLSFQSGKYGLLLIEGEVPVWVLILCIGVFLSGIVFFTTTNERPPRYHFLYSLLGFVVSTLWISTVASEIVSVLHLLGVVLSLSNTVLGLTLLAWGNSIGDCFADIAIARQGYPRMAISACFGGIIFNMLFGVGLGCLLQIFQTNNVVMLEPEGMLCWVLSGALGLSLVLSFILVPLQCFHLNRVYGIFLLIFYIVFLLVALLTEFRVIQF
uniref:Sodium/potassium/calcium exchanger 6, mitochondrial-like n=1 Tax=Sinocyclocheilus rhinocerous TaxID=307959 RepID=A0A673IFV7_9TELE